MPFKKLSRRTFLTASSVLAFLHTPFARALPARPSVNINDYNPHDWIASFKQAFSEGHTVVVPAGLVCDNINTGIFIPPGKNVTHPWKPARQRQRAFCLTGWQPGDRGGGRQYA
ncbi:colanic acid biosynthesis protein [Escherichia coli]|nr:colanic acid biosynthesis protein [Escherichia coli]